MVGVVTDGAAVTEPRSDARRPDPERRSCASQRPAVLRAKLGL